MSASGSDLAAGHPRSWAGSALGQLLALLGLTGLAISQPLLSVLGDNPTLFVYNNVDGSELIAVALAVALVPPLALWLVTVIVRLFSRRAADVVFAGIATVLAGCAAVQFVKWLGVENAVAVTVLAAIVAAGFAVALVRWAPVREWLRYLAVLPALAVVLFLVASPTRDLLERRDAVEPTAEGAYPPVVFVMLDELPTKSLLAADGGIDRVRFPNLASLADESTWYRNYTVQSSWTEVSVPAILSGREPEGGRAGLWTDYPDTIFSLLAPTHELTAFETFTSLCGFDDCRGGTDAAEVRTGDLFSRVVEVWRDRITPGHTPSIDVQELVERVATSPTESDGDGADGVDAILDADETDAIGRIVRALGTRPTRAQAFIDSIHAEDARSLYYLHLLYPHQPWTLGPQGRVYVDDERNTPAGASAPTAWDLALQEQRHLWQARYTDQVVGQVVARLRETGLYDDALVVVTADHGVTFDGTEGRRVSEEAISDVAYAPLFVKLPGQVEGRIDDSNLMSVDVLPTVAEAVGVSIPWKVDGYPAGSPQIEERGEEKVIYDFFSPSSTEWDRVLRFDDSARPRASDRAIGPISPDASPITGLVATLGLEGQLGRSIEEFPPASVATVDSASLQVLREPVTGYAPVGALVEGRISPEVPDGRVLIALNGVIVSAAPVENGAFRTIIPPADIRRGGNEVQVVLLSGDEVTLLQLP